MRYQIIILTLLAAANEVYGQFPFIAGKEGNGVARIGKAEGLMNYDFGASRIGFTVGKYLDGREKIGCTDYDRFTTITGNLGLAANENTFVVFSKDFKPGADFSLDFVFGRGYCKDGDKTKLIASTRYLRLLTRNQKVKYLDSLVTEVDAVFEKTKWDVGINFGNIWQPQFTDVENAQWFVSTGVYVGYARRDEGNLKEYEVETEIASPGSVLIQKTEKRFIGSPVDQFIAKLFLDGGRRIKQLYGRDEKASTRALYLIGRLHPEYQGSEEFKLHFMGGITLNSFTNVVIGGLLFEFDDVTNRAFDDAFTVKLYAGIPITFSKQSRQ